MSSVNKFLDCLKCKSSMVMVAVLLVILLGNMCCSTKSQSIKLYPILYFTFVRTHKEAGSFLMRAMTSHLGKAISSMGKLERMRLLSA